MKNKFFPKVTMNENEIILNLEAIETMELDVENASVILSSIINPEKKRNNKEIFILKANGSLCDDTENIKDAFSPECVRKIRLITSKEEISCGIIPITEIVSEEIKSVFGSTNEFKLLLCNNESPMIKNLKEQLNISANAYRFANIDEEKTSIGKEKNIKEVTVERISIN